MESSWGSLWCWGRGSNLSYSRRYRGGGSLWKGRWLFLSSGCFQTSTQSGPSVFPKNSALVITSPCSRSALHCSWLQRAGNRLPAVPLDLCRPNPNSGLNLYQTCLHSRWMTAREPWTWPEKSPSKPGEGDGQDCCSAGRRWRGDPAPGRLESPSWQNGSPGRREERKMWRGEGAVGTAQGSQRWGCLSAAHWDACHLSRLELVIQQSSFSLYFFFLLFRQIVCFFGYHIEFISDLMPEDIRYEI